MNRRDVVKSLGALAVAAVAGPGIHAQKETPVQLTVPTPSGDRPWPNAVAGIQIIDSKIATEATALCREVSTPSMFNHAMRVYLLGSLTGKAQGLKFDAELLYLGCVFHDFGLSERYMGDMSYDVQGAEAARSFLEARGVSRENCSIVWDGVALHNMHPSPYRAPESFLVGYGAGADVIGPDFDETKKEQVDEVVKAFPRLKFKQEFINACANVARKHPRGAAANTITRSIGERLVPGFSPGCRICDLVPKAPFEE